MLKYLLALLLFIALPALADDGDEDASCTAYADIPVNVTPRFDTPVYDYSKNIDQLALLSADTHKSIREGMPLGLTRYEPMLELKAPMVSITRSDGVNCTKIKHIDVTLGYKNVIVYIAKEIPQGSCGFKEVMGHEHQHIDANRIILDKYAPIVEQEMASYLKISGVQQQTSSDEAYNLIHEQLDTLITKITDKMMYDNEIRQRNIDTPYEYRRVSNSCNGQLQGVLRQFMQTGQ